MKNNLYAEIVNSSKRYDTLTTSLNNNHNSSFMEFSQTVTVAPVTLPFDADVPYLLSVVKVVFFVNS